MTRFRRIFSCLLAVFALGVLLCTPSLAILPSEEEYQADAYSTTYLFPGDDVALDVPYSQEYWSTSTDVVVLRVSVLEYPVLAPGEPPSPDGLIFGIVFFDSSGMPVSVNNAPYTYLSQNEPFVTLVVPPYSTTYDLTCRFYNNDENEGGALVQMAYYSYENFTAFLTEEYAMRGLTDSSSYQNGYNNGYSLGSANGYEEGHEVGYGEASSRYAAIRAAGYQEGYSFGLSASDIGNFSDLFNAVVSAPVNIVASMFNFELLGTNLATLFFFVFTVLFIFAVLSLLRRFRS